MKALKFSFAPVPALIALSIAALVAWGVSHWTGFSFWGALGITIIAMLIYGLINGLIAEAEDNEPGGFNNPLPRNNSNPPAENANNKTGSV